MFEVKITASPELVQAINNLAAALSGVRFQAANPIQGQTAAPTGAPAAPVTAPPMGTPAPAAPTTGPAAAPSNFPGQTYAAPAPTANPTPVAGSATPAQTGAPAAPMAGPTSAYPSNPPANPMPAPTGVPTAQMGAPAYQTGAPASTYPSNPPAQAGVPLAQTQPQQYTVDQIMAAGATLMDSGRVDDLVNLLHTFGVAAVTDLKPEQMGAFATALRGLGAKI